MVNDPSLVNYAQTIDLLNKRVNGLIGSYNHLKTEYEHFILVTKEMKDRIDKLEKQNKDLRSCIERCEDSNGKSSARKIRKSTI